MACTLCLPVQGFCKVLVKQVIATGASGPLLIHVAFWFWLCVIVPELYAIAWSCEHLVQCPTVFPSVQRKAPEYILLSSSPHQIHLFRKLRRFLLAHQCPSQTQHGQDKLTNKALGSSQHASRLLGSQWLLDKLCWGCHPVLAVTMCVQLQCPARTCKINKLCAQCAHFIQSCTI